MLFGFDSCADASRCVAAIIGAGIVPVAMEYMDRPAIAICEDFAHAGYPLDVEAMLIVEVEGSEAEMTAELARIAAIAKAHGVRVIARIDVGDGERADLEGPQVALSARSAASADYICMDGTVPTSRLPEALRRIGEMCAAYGLRVANIFHAGDGNMHPLILYDVNDPASMQKAEEAGADILKLCVELGGCLTGEHGVGIEKRDLMRRPVHRRRTRPADARARGVRSARPAQSGQGFPARREGDVTVLEAASARSRRRSRGGANGARSARGRGERLDIVGGGTRAGLGRPAEGARRLSTRSPDRNRLP